MNFWVVICALALNIATGWLFKPYALWITRLHTGLAQRLSAKKYKTVVRYGGTIAIACAIFIWFIVDYLIMLLEYQSEVYSYIAYGVVIYFCTCCGQITGIIRKFSGNTKNTVFIRQLFGYMLVPDAAKAESNRFKKLFSQATVRLVAEKIVMPFMLLLVFGAGATAAYSFINHFASSDNSEEMTLHGYAATAVSLNKIISAPGYAMLSLLLWAVKWILNMKFCFKGYKLHERCEKQLSAFESSPMLTERFIRSTGAIVYACTVMMLLILISLYIFVQAAFAAFGLDEYWDFWSGKNINKEQ